MRAPCRRHEEPPQCYKSRRPGPGGRHFVLSACRRSGAETTRTRYRARPAGRALPHYRAVLAGIQLGAVNAFIAVYATAMFVTDSITAILLYAQFSILRSRAILVIASGYLFTALIIVPYVLAFPGVLTPSGVVGGLQTAAWLYVLWHCGFAIFVIGYALSKDEDPGKRLRQGTVRSAILRSVAWTAAIAAAAALLCIDDEAVLPRIMLDPLRFSPEWPYLVGAPIALTVRFRARRALASPTVDSRSLVDGRDVLVLDRNTSEILSGPDSLQHRLVCRRVIGFLSSSVVLMVLLYEITTLYGGSSARCLVNVANARRA